MEELINRLNELFRRQFPGSTPELEQAKPLQKVGGFLIWNGFAGVEQIDRQAQLRATIRDHFKPAEQLQLTTILTVTPEEVALMR